MTRAWFWEDQERWVDFKMPFFGLNISIWSCKHRQYLHKRHQNASRPFKLPLPSLGGAENTTLDGKTCRLRTLPGFSRSRRRLGTKKQFFLSENNSALTTLALFVAFLAVLYLDLFWFMLYNFSLFPLKMLIIGKTLGEIISLRLNVKY